MSTRSTIIVFTVLFAAGVILVVILPFVIGQGPSSPAAGDRVRRGEAPVRGVFRSDDDGATWQAQHWVEGGEGSVSGFSVNRLLTDPVDPATLYLATDGNGLWVSKSRGEVWAPVSDSNGLLAPRSNVLAVALNPANREEWYVASFQGERGRVLKSGDGGRSFYEVYFTPAERFGVFDVAFDPGRGTVLIATGQGGLLETVDRGRSWRVIRWFADGLLRVFIHPANPRLWFVASARGRLFKSEDRGVTWTDITAAYGDRNGTQRDQHWLMDQFGTLYLGSRRGLLASRDLGATFIEPPLIIPPDVVPVLAIAVDPRDARRMAVSAASQLYLTEDGSASWQIRTAPGAGRITHLLFDHGRRGTIYAVVQP